jgi:hypothetical protein
MFTSCFKGAAIKSTIQLLQYGQQLQTMMFSCFCRYIVAGKMKCSVKGRIGGLTSTTANLTKVVCVG